MLNIESRFVVGPSNTMFTGVYVCTYQPANFTGCGSEGVNQTVQNIRKLYNLFCVLILFRNAVNFVSDFLGVFYLRAPPEARIEGRTSFRGLDTQSSLPPRLEDKVQH